MTHEKLIEKVAKDIKHYYGNEFDVVCAKRCIATILAELQEPTEEMMSWGMGTLEDKRKTWRAWINASPLAK